MKKRKTGNRLSRREVVLVTIIIVLALVLVGLLIYNFSMEKDMASLSPYGTYWAGDDTPIPTLPVPEEPPLR